ncbi:MAG: hypothetical protein DCE87_12570 [Betaproteobacteria bacterium]|nr:hypothetical protein [Alcaligenaceae bacterium]PZO13767.1 MAG: hypothetical protein DCE87_12570 [Betaproteobacteria bacterium]PZO23680.1 MAG: hypothetical protein DCE89_09180 [Betaproteobacteria bacterium]PZO30330.1 MAG: hypothetical protein DCE88_05925 [Betaproteobacteria bacterium]
MEWIRREAAPQDALAFAASIPNGVRTATAAIFTLGGAVERSDWGKASQARSLAASKNKATRLRRKKPRDFDEHSYAISNSCTQ